MARIFFAGINRYYYQYESEKLNQAVPLPDQRKYPVPLLFPGSKTYYIQTH